MDEAEMSGEEGSLPRGMRTTAGFAKQLWMSCQHIPPLGVSCPSSGRHRGYRGLKKRTSMRAMLLSHQI